MDWFRTELNISGTDYVQYVMAENIYVARLIMVRRYGSKIASKSRIDEVSENPELKKIRVKLNDLRVFNLYEVVCNEEHAKTLCYQKYGTKNIKEILIINV